MPDDVTLAPDVPETEPSRLVATDLRQRTARGTIINGAFQIGLAGLNLLRRLVIAAFLTAEEFGLWGVLLATLFLIIFIKDAGIGDRFVQQDEANQEHAFQKLFTIDLLLGVTTLLLAAAALPLFSRVYGYPEIVVPGMVLSLAVIGNSLQSPNIIYYREMNFVRQRTLQAVDPCTAFVVTVSLAIAGSGYWSLIVGAVVGSFAGAAVALYMCPYRIAFRLERGTVSDYFGFSWPLLVARASFLLTGQAALLIATRTLGLAGAGAIGMSGSITQFSRGVDGIVTQTLYPAICAVRDRRQLLFEAFVKSNRLALMWGMPFGLGITLFAPDLVHFILGDRWAPAIVLLQALGLVAASDQLGFNWTAFMRALNRTRPLAVLAVLGGASFVAITAPLLIAFGLPGLAAGWLGAQIVNVVGRGYFLRRVFSGFRLMTHAARAIAPSIVPVALVVGVRTLEAGPRIPRDAIVELLLYVLSTVAATWLFERNLLLELLGYLRSRPVIHSGNSSPETTGTAG